VNRAALLALLFGPRATAMLATLDLLLTPVACCLSHALTAHPSGACSVLAVALQLSAGAAIRRAPCGRN